jgi:hypothetical protein
MASSVSFSSSPVSTVSLVTTRPSASSPLPGDTRAPLPAPWLLKRQKSLQQLCCSETHSGSFPDPDCRRNDYVSVNIQETRQSVTESFDFGRVLCESYEVHDYYVASQSISGSENQKSSNGLFIIPSRLDSHFVDTCSLELFTAFHQSYFNVYHPRIVSYA